MSVVSLFPGRSVPSADPAQPAGYDERCAADLAAVADGRGLSRVDAGWLVRAVCGAIRPNRDRPTWDLAHALAALSTGGRNGRDLLDIVLDPRLADPGALSRALSGGGSADASGPVWDGGAKRWHTTWSTLARLLALAEFVLTADDLARFAEVRTWLDDIAADPGAEGVSLLAGRLSRSLAAYRNAHLPLAPHEKRFRAILQLLSGRTAFDDDDILALWRAELEAGERPGFATIASHFATFEAVTAALGGLTGLAGATSLDALPGAADRLEAGLSDVGAGEPADAPITLLGAVAGDVKVLTGAESDDLAEWLRLDPFHRSRPLTVLRAASFGQVQSGIANRLRRGGGGADVAERTACGDARPYPHLAERCETLLAHLRRMIAIAAALRIPPERRDARSRAALDAAETDLNRLRRAGFDRDREALAAVFAGMDEALVRLEGEMAAGTQALSALAARQSLPALFEDDRAIFAECLGRAYAEARP